MSDKSNPVSSKLNQILSDPLSLACAAVATALIATLAVVWFPYRRSVTPTHGALPYLAPPSALALEGSAVYYQEGCQYCHTQALRPFAWEAARFANAEAYGYYLLPDAMEYYFETPSQRGSLRLGPDLARVAGKLDQAQLEALLKSDKTDTQRAAYHRFGHLFESDAGINPLMLAWRIRMNMQSASPLSDPYQRSAFDQLDGKTRGDALVAYLLSLGKKQSEFAGKYYN